ncbi:MAG: hypothetical protein J6B95_06335 [Oscillospiraceae bacterium]|nr:hypothetical protein [Oscillospiraceae bacterium]
MKKTFFRIIAAILTAILLGAIFVSRELDLKLLTAFLFYILAVILLIK